VDSVSSSVAVAAPLSLTSHPLQRAGAWAVSVLADRKQPQDVTAEDLEKVADRLVEDICTAAVAGKGDAVYDWWKVLFALYPNAKATHSKRPRDREVLRIAVADLFAPDGADAPATHPCTFCGIAASVVWTKTNLPLFDTNKALNTLPPSVPGWPVCRGCRVAAWALPYGAWVTAGSATVLSCETEVAERRFVQRNVLRARRVMQLGFAGLRPGARPELVALHALRAARAELSATTLWTFKNDNQEPWLRVTHTRRAVPRFLATVEGNVPLHRGWRLLELSLTQGYSAGAVTVSGPAEAARLLFEAEDGRNRSLLSQLHRLLDDDPGRRWTPQHRADLTRLAFTYAKEVLGMEPNLTPVATVVADWIEHGSGSPRGRLAEYRKAALKGYELGHLLTEAAFRLTLDGRPAKAGPADWKPLIRQQPRAWEHRMLLAASVLQLLQERGVAVHDEPASAEERDLAEQLLERPMLGDEDDDDDMGAA
jgi:CRISPR-associated protein Cst1